MVILNGNAETSNVHVIHPPIDGILLNTIRKAPEIQSTHKKAWRKVKWTKLGEDEYFRLIDQLRLCVGRDEPFWTLERYWTVTEDQE